MAACGPDGAVWGRDGADYSARYPELAVLGRLPAGTILDGELVRWGPEGLPNLGAILKRHHLTHPARVEQASQSQPVCYVVFDLLYLRGRSLLGGPLQRRREALQGTASAATGAVCGLLGRGGRRGPGLLRCCGGSGAGGNDGETSSQRLPLRTPLCLLAEGQAGARPRVKTPVQARSAKD